MSLFPLLGFPQFIFPFFKEVIIIFYKSNKKSINLSPLFQLPLMLPGSIPDPFSPSRCGFGSGQIMRFRPDPDPDPQHCKLGQISQSGVKAQNRFTWAVIINNADVLRTYSVSEGGGGCERESYVKILAQRPYLICVIFQKFILS